MIYWCYICWFPEMFVVEAVEGGSKVRYQPVCHLSIIGWVLYIDIIYWRLLWPITRGNLNYVNNNFPSVQVHEKEGKLIFCGRITPQFSPLASFLITTNKWTDGTGQASSLSQTWISKRHQNDAKSWSKKDLHFRILDFFLSSSLRTTISRKQNHGYHGI